MKEYSSTKQQQLLGLAYQMIGEKAPSQDICQEVWIRYWKRSQEITIVEPMAYLRRMVINACLDYLQKVAQERANYEGPWLPEPLLEVPSYSHLDLSYGCTVLLSRLNPKERAVFVLRKCFDYSYKELASVLELTAANCRKIYQRIQPKIQEEITTPMVELTPDFEKQFLEASGTGKLEAFIQLLKEDIALYSDGGGKAVAARQPLYGWTICKAFLEGIIKKAGNTIQIQPIWIHQQWGWRVLEGNKVTTLVLCDWKEGQIQHLYLMRNPEKIPL